LKNLRSWDEGMTLELLQMLAFAAICGSTAFARGAK
jgi:hypothetical protein